MVPQSHKREKIVINNIILIQFADKNAVTMGFLFNLFMGYTSIYLHTPTACTYW